MMPRRDAYPATVAEILDDRMTFRPAALRALRAFRRARPWRGTAPERFAKLRALNTALADAYGIAEPLLVPFLIDATAESNGICRRQPGGRCEIILIGRLSVVTYLHEFGHARGFGERQATRWSVNLFRRIFPRSYARLQHVGHRLVR
jgi:hypothetical protein